MMLRRVFSTVASKKNCSDCRLYIRATKTCKLNNLNAFDNRLNDNICGIEGKKFWALDDTQLIISQKYEKIVGYFGVSGILSAFVWAFIDTNAWFLFSTCASFYFGLLFIDLSEDAKKKYLNNDDNNDNI